jgi:thiaminase
MALHVEYCKSFGLSKEEIEAHEESQGWFCRLRVLSLLTFKACIAYTRYMLDIGQSDDWLALQIAFAPCLLGYGLIARRLYDDPETLREGNLYWKWIENYVAKDYNEAVLAGSGISFVEVEMNRY